MFLYCFFSVLSNFRNWLLINSLWAPGKQIILQSLEKSDEYYMKRHGSWRSNHSKSFEKKILSESVFQNILKNN